MDERDLSWLPPDFKVPAMHVIKWLSYFEKSMREKNQFFDSRCMGRAIDAFICYTEEQMAKSGECHGVNIDDILAS